MLIQRSVRRLSGLVAALGVAVVLSGCGPSQAGAAAIVGDQSVSLADVQAQIDAITGRPDVMAELALEGERPDTVARRVVAQRVKHLLLVKAARRAGITVTDQQLAAAMARPASVAIARGRDLVFDPAGLRESVRDDLIAQALARRTFNRLSVTVDVTSADSRDEALRKARRLAAGPAQADAVLTADARNAQRNVQLKAVEFAQSADVFLFGTPAGQVVATQFGAGPDTWTLVRVTRRGTDGPPPTGDAATALDQLGEGAADEIGRRYTQPLAEQLGVRVNPRYGTWDPIYLSVMPPGQPASIVLTSSAG